MVCYWYFLLFLYLSSHWLVVFVLGRHIAKSTVKSLTTRNITITVFPSVFYKEVTQSQQIFATVTGSFLTVTALSMACIGATTPCM